MGVWCELRTCGACQGEAGRQGELIPSSSSFSLSWALLISKYGVLNRQTCPALLYSLHCMADSALPLLPCNASTADWLSSR